MSENPTIGVLALQGAVEPHKAHIEAAGAQFAAVKTVRDFEAVDAFILPGGESTTMLKLIERFGLWDVLAEQFMKKPVWGICAGSILLAERVFLDASSRDLIAGSTKAENMDPVVKPRGDAIGAKTQKSFGLLPITITRNGYGRQIDSHHGQVQGYPVSFIRAPVIEEARCEIVAEQDGTPIWVRSGTIMATTFHPELTLDFPSPMHRYFIDMVKNS